MSPTIRTGAGRFSAWAGASATLLIAVIAFTVQWGVVTTKLDGMEKRLDEFLAEARMLRQEYADMTRRLALVEGQLRVKP